MEGWSHGACITHKTKDEWINPRLGAMAKGSTRTQSNKSPRHSCFGEGLGSMADHENTPGILCGMDNLESQPHID